MIHKHKPHPVLLPLVFADRCLPSRAQRGREARCGRVEPWCTVVSLTVLNDSCPNEPLRIRTLDRIALSVNGPPGIGPPIEVAESAVRREIGPAPAGRDSAAKLDSIGGGRGAVSGEPGSSSAFNDLTRPSCESAR